MNWKKFSRFALVPTLAVMALPVSAGNINVLWYTGGVEATAPGSYSAAIAALAADAPSAPGGNTWTVTEWASGTMPGGIFNVLVVASPEGEWSTNPDYLALAAAAPGITLGDRVMITGQDADWHNIFGPGPTPFDGPHGFLLDGINWAGSGTGLGLVSLGADANDYGFALTGYTNSGGSTDGVTIPAAYASFPINTGLTSAGLSNWGTSAHVEFTNLDTTKWTGINVDTFDASQYVTIVSAATSGGGVTPSPEPATMFLLGSTLIACAIRRGKFGR
jgi:hypothetical protein